MYLPHYYIIYSVACAILAIGLSQILRHAGAIFLEDAFRGNPDVASAVTHLLDIGFYLICLGYVAVSYQTFMPMNTVGQVAQVISIKLGIFLLILGCMHFFNLLLLALFRRRTTFAAAPAAS